MIATATLRVKQAEGAHRAVCTKGSQTHGHHNALKAQLEYKRAILATAHKLLGMIVAMSRDQGNYVDRAIACDKLVVARNAARWLRKLEEHGCFEDACWGGQPAAA